MKRLMFLLTLCMSLSFCTKLEGQHNGFTVPQLYMNYLNSEISPLKAQIETLQASNPSMFLTGGCLVQLQTYYVSLIDIPNQLQGLMDNYAAYCLAHGGDPGNTMTEYFLSRCDTYQTFIVTVTSYYNTQVPICIPPPPSLTIDNVNTQFQLNGTIVPGQSATVHVTASTSTNWTVSKGTYSWITLSGNISKTGSGTFTIAVSSTPAERTGTLTITSNAPTKTVTVYQSNDY